MTAFRAHELSGGCPRGSIAFGYFRIGAAGSMSIDIIAVVILVIL